MDPSRVAKIAYGTQVEGKRERGRPRWKWEEGVREACQRRGIDWQKRKELAGDRQSWTALYKKTPNTA